MKSLKDRFEDLDRRIADLRKRTHPVTPEEHDIGELMSDLLGRHERMRGYLDSHRGTGATWASEKDAPEGATGGASDRPAIADDAEAEQEMDAMERAYDRAATRRPPD